MFTERLVSVLLITFLVSKGAFKIDLYGELNWGVISSPIKSHCYAVCFTCEDANIWICSAVH